MVPPKHLNTRAGGGSFIRVGEGIKSSSSRIDHRSPVTVTGSGSGSGCCPLYTLCTLYTFYTGWSGDQVIIVENRPSIAGNDNGNGLGLGMMSSLHPLHFLHRVGGGGGKQIQSPGVDS